MKKIFIFGSIILIMIFAFLHFSKPCVQPIKVFTKTLSHKVDDSDPLCRQIDKVVAEYNADCQKLLSAFMADLERNIAPDFDRANRAVPKVIDDLSGFNVCVKLCYKAAKDKLKDTHDFMDAYMTAMDEPIIQPCVHANAVASDMLQTLQLRLKERHAQYVTDLATICNNDSLTGELPGKDLENLQNCLGNFAGSVQELHNKKVAAGIGVAFETIFIRQTCGFIVKLFAKPAAKICSSLGAAGICAVADGPLPVGDIAGAVLTVGGLAWTAYDIYDISCVMPKKLNSELRNGIASTKAKLLNESREQARKIAQAYQQSGREINQELKAQLN